MRTKKKDRPPDWADPLPRAIICDHDLEDRKTFEAHTGLATIGARKEVRAGIQEVGARLRPAGDGKPRLMYFEDCLVEADPHLVKSKKPNKKPRIDKIRGILNEGC